jgi:hypothetical protein
MLPSHSHKKIHFKDIPNLDRRIESQMLYQLINKTIKTPMWEIIKLAIDTLQGIITTQYFILIVTKQLEYYALFGC